MNNELPLIDLVVEVTTKSIDTDAYGSDAPSSAQLCKLDPCCRQVKIKPLGMV